MPQSAASATTTFGRGLRVVGFERRVTIAFEVDDERVTILRIFYGGVDWERAL